MKIQIKLVTLFLFIIPQLVFAGGSEQRSCATDELFISLVDYSYCTPNGEVKSLNILGGKHNAVYVAGRDYEYSFARMPVSIALMDIPSKKGISLSLFFKRLADVRYTKGRFTEIRTAFDIGEKTVVSKYSNKGFVAYYIINENSLNNSIYIFNDNNEYIYVVKGSITGEFSQEFLSSLEYIY